MIYDEWNLSATSNCQEATTLISLATSVANIFTPVSAPLRTVCHYTAELQVSREQVQCCMIDNDRRWLTVHVVPVWRRQCVISRVQSSDSELSRGLLMLDWTVMLFTVCIQQRHKYHSEQYKYFKHIKNKFEITKTIQNVLKQLMSENAEYAPSMINQSINQFFNYRNVKTHFHMRKTQSSKIYVKSVNTYHNITF